MNQFFQTLGSLRDIIIYVSLGISIPSFLLYCSECAVIIRHRKLHNSFNWLFIARAIPNLFNFLSSLFGYRLPIILGASLLPIYQLLPYWVLKLYWFLFYFCIYADNLATVFIQFNRLMAVLFPMKYEQFWQKLFPISLAIVFVLPFFMTYFYFMMGIKISVKVNDPYSGNATTFSISETGTNYVGSYTPLFAYFSILFLFVCTGINVITLILYKWNTRTTTAMLNQAHTNNNQASQRIERNLMIYAMGTFFGHAIFALYMISFTIKFENNSTNTLMSLSPLITDFGILWLPSWFLIWANMAFRDQWVADVLPKRLVKYWHKQMTNVINVQPQLQTNMAFNLVTRRQPELISFSRSAT